jgi:hypothetical protein
VEDDDDDAAPTVVDPAHTTNPRIDIEVVLPVTAMALCNMCQMCASVC